MRKTSTVGRFSLLAAVVIACGPGCTRAPAKPPDLHEYSLAGQKAPNRAYWAAGVDPCRVERSLAADEARAMNALLSKFLEQTAFAPDSVWPADALALLEQGAQSLPAELEVYERTLTSLSRCRPDKTVDVAPIAEEGTRLVEQARARLPNAEQVVANVRRTQAVAEWRAKELALQNSERQAWCPPRPTPKPDIYFAWQDETGRLEWLFCDGSKVVAEPNADPQYVEANPPPAKKPAMTPSGFVQAARGFPESEIRRPPNFDAPPAAPEGEAAPETATPSES